MKNVACVGLPYTQYKTPISNTEEQGRNIEMGTNFEIEKKVEVGGRQLATTSKLAKISVFLAFFSLRDNIINSCPLEDRSSVLASQYITLMKKKCGPPEEMNP